MSIYGLMNTFKYLVDDRDLSCVQYIPETKRMNARENSEHTFKRRFEAESYRLEELYYYHKARDEISKSKEYFHQLTTLEEDYPEWQI